MQTGNQDKAECIPDSLIQSIDVIYRPNGLVVTDLVRGLESKNYGACSFILNSKVVEFRVPRTTPKKIGQFVTLWKRAESGPIKPYDLMDSADLFVVSIQQKDCYGQFVFPKALLSERGIVSRDGVGGKRAIRVYPPWDNPVSQQGRRTQAWQLEYFLDVSADAQFDSGQLQKLYGIALQ